MGQPTACSASGFRNRLKHTHERLLFSRVFMPATSGDLYGTPIAGPGRSRGDVSGESSVWLYRAYDSPCWPAASVKGQVECGPGSFRGIGYRVAELPHATAKSSGLVGAREPNAE